jgi:hypothetical protein
MDYVDDAPKNWTLSSSSSTPTFSGTPVAQRPNLSDNQMSNRAYKYMVPNGYKDHESSSESSGEETLVSSKVMFLVRDYHILLDQSPQAELYRILAIQQFVHFC